MMVYKDETEWTHYVNGWKAVYNKNLNEYFLEDGATYYVDRNTYCLYTITENGSITYELIMDWEPKVVGIDENSFL